MGQTNIQSVGQSVSQSVSTAACLRLIPLSANLSDAQAREREERQRQRDKRKKKSVSVWVRSEIGAVPVISDSICALRSDLPRPNALCPTAVGVELVMNSPARIDS